MTGLVELLNDPLFAIVSGIFLLAMAGGLGRPSLWAERFTVVVFGPLFVASLATMSWLRLGPTLTIVLAVFLCLGFAIVSFIRRQDRLIPSLDYEK